MTSRVEEEALYSRLVQLEARTNFIKSNLPTRTPRRIRDDFKAFHGFNPPRGRPHEDANFFIKTPQRNIESSLLAIRFKMLRLFTGSSTPEFEHSVTSIEGLSIFCDAYEDFQSIASQTEITFTHAFNLLVGNLRTGELTLTSCGDCSGAYLSSVHHRGECPHCAERQAIVNRRTNDQIGLDDNNEQNGENITKTNTGTEC